jgi:UPF0271 protein
MGANEVNINADLGEGAGQDDKLMPLLTSCNIACGGHTGDEQSVIETVRLAKKYDVKIGAHPSYPDRKNFGRQRPEINDDGLSKSLVEQLDLFFRIAEQEKVEVHHIKAHGALYNDAASDKTVAELFLKSIASLGINARIYTPFNSILHQSASSKLSFSFEAFIDRAYNDDLSLVSREHVKALHKTKEQAWNQFYEMHYLEEVTSISGKKRAIKADTYCIHGDHPQALNMLEYIRMQLLRTQV